MAGLAKLYIALTGKKTAPAGLDAEGLLAALEAAGRVVSADWKEDPSEAASGLAAMAQRAGVAKKTAHALLDIDEEEMEEYLPRAAGILRDAGASILEIDVGADEYNLAVLREAVARAAVAAAKGAKGVKAKVVRAAPKPKAKGRSEAAKTDGDSPEAMRRAVVVLEKARAKREKSRARYPDLAPSFSDANVSVCIGMALAAAGTPAEQWRVPWAHAGALAQHLTDVAERFGYVHLGVEFFDAVCAAWLAGAEGPIFELLGRTLYSSTNRRIPT